MVSLLLEQAPMHIGKVAATAENPISDKNSFRSILIVVFKYEKKPSGGVEGI